MMMGRSVCGVGLYRKGKFPVMNDGKISASYRAWSNMLRRCYDPYTINEDPTYIDCYVCDEWCDFQNFSEWFYLNHPKDGCKYHLDKDLKVIGNKVYSPEFCMFVPQNVNKFIVDCGASRGDYLIGARLHKASGRFISECSNPILKKREHLGYFSSEIDAHMAWRMAKSNFAYELAEMQEDKAIKEALLNWRSLLDKNKIHTVLPTN